MIVVDTDVIAAFWIRVPRTPAAIEARRRDPDWAAPLLWRSEFRSVLRQYLIAKHMDAATALTIAEKAESSMQGNEYALPTEDVLRLVARTKHSSYDCEFVALAQARGLTLVTGDTTVVRLFPKTAVLLEDFAR